MGVWSMTDCFSMMRSLLSIDVEGTGTVGATGGDTADRSTTYI